MNVKLKAALWRFAGFFKPGRSRVGELPSDVIQYLSPDNPFLKELKNDTPFSMSRPIPTGSFGRIKSTFSSFGAKMITSARLTSSTPPGVTN
jgi:hypothetical protein